MVKKKLRRWPVRKALFLMSVAEGNIHMFIKHIFLHQEGVSASLNAAMCSSMVAICLADLYVRPVEAPCPLQGGSFHSPSSSSCCCSPVGHTRQAQPKLSHSCLAPLHSSNNANYISNGNRWALVSSSHSLERFINIHQRGHWLVRAPTFKGWTSQGAAGPIR